MRICMFSRSVREHIMGGMETHAHQLALGLFRRGHQVTVLTTARPDGSTGYQQTPYLTRFLPAPSGRYSRAWWRESVAAFADLHSAEPFDLIWSQSAGALGYLDRQHAQPAVPVVAMMHGSIQGELLRRRYAWPSPRSVALVVAYLPSAAKFARGWRRLGPRLAAAIVPSREMLAENQRELGLPPERMALVPWGVDLDLFSPDPLAGQAVRARLGIPAEAQVLLFAGRLTAQKGGAIALAAFRRLAQKYDNTFLLYAGTGRQQAALQRTVSRAGLAQRVRFLDRIEHEDLADYYNAADICLFPWLAWEASPLVLPEALACGRPVVASAVGWAPSVLDLANVGLLVDPGDAGALATAIEHLLTAPEAAQEMGRTARRLAEAEFGIETMVARIEAVLTSCARSRARP